LLSGNYGVTCKAHLEVRNMNKFGASKCFLMTGANKQFAVTAT